MPGPDREKIGERSAAAVLAVVMIAALIIAGEHLGCAALTSAVMALRCGHAIEVPDSMLKSPAAAVERSTGKGQAARMLTQGLMMSGLRMLWSVKEGPQKENDATVV